jgi:hypothetical protein
MLFPECSDLSEMEVRPVFEPHRFAEFTFAVVQSQKKDEQQHDQDEDE